MKKFKHYMIILAVAITFTACATHVHTIGDGPKGNTEVSEVQWYALWGLVPINDVDSQKMAGGAENYQIKTETSFVDGLIGIVTTYVTVNRRTVTVTK